MRKILLYVVCMLSLSSPLYSSANEYQLENFMILVDEQLIIQGYATFQPFAATNRRSDVGSRNSALIGGMGATYIPSGAPSLQDMAIISPNVTLKNHARVSHVIYDAATGSFNDVGTAGRVGPSLLEDDLGNNSLNNTGIKALPDFPAFPSFSIGSVDIIIPSSGNASPHPGSYRDLVIGSNAKIRFETGVYNFRRIITTAVSKYQLLFEDDVQLNVKEFVNLREFGLVNPGFSKGLAIYVEGTDGSYGGANKNPKGVTELPAAFYYGGDGEFNACLVFVKNGTILLKGYSTPPWTTQWFGKSFKQHTSLKITLQQSNEFCVGGCSCITSFKLLTDGRLRIRGINLTKSSVAKLAVWKKTDVIPIESVTGGDIDIHQKDLLFITSDVMETKIDVTSIIPPGDYLLGLFYPSAGTKGFCILQDKVLVIP